MSSERQPWEYADGPDVGRDIPITSEPRKEQAPGVLRPPSGGPDEESKAVQLEERAVRVDDPGLDTEANERLTEEVRETLGTDRVRVPSDRPRPSQGERPEKQTLFASLSSHRLTVVITLAAFLTIGAIISLATGSWWFLGIALGVHALGTLIVTSTALRVTTLSEHPSPTVAATLEEAGIRNPDEHFSRIVEEFSEAEDGDGSDAEEAGDASRTASAMSNSPEASAEQSSAMTPTAEPSESVRGGELPQP